MVILYLIYVPIFLMLLYLVVGTSIDVIDWLIAAIRQRRLARLLASYKQQWWGRGGASGSVAPVTTAIAANIAQSEPDERASASLSPTSAPASSSWNGVERRGRPNTLRPFRDYAELDQALDVVLQAELAEARYKLANSDIWHAIGLVQQRAVDDVRRLIATIPRDTGHITWQQSLYQQLLALADRYKHDPPDDDELYWRIDDDQWSFYSPTVWAFVRAIIVH